MSSSRKRGEMNSKLHMDRQPTIARITDPSLPAGKRREIDNVMKKARGNTNDYWDKKLLEAEEKDPNRWRHSGYKKMYIQGESSESEGGMVGPSHGRVMSGGGYHYNSGAGGPPPVDRMYERSRSPRSRSHSRMRKSSPSPIPMRRRSPMGRRGSPTSSMESSSRGRLRSPPTRVPPRSPFPFHHRSPPPGRHRSPPPISSHRRSPQSSASSMSINKRGQILPRSKRPPSPPPRNVCRSRSRSSVSSCTDDSCSVCSLKRPRSRSRSHLGGGPRSPPSKPSRAMPYRHEHSRSGSSRVHGRTMSPASLRAIEKYREEKRQVRGNSAQMKMSRSSRHSPASDVRVKGRPPEPPEPSSSSDFTSTAAAATKKKKKEKEVRPRIKIEGEKHSKRNNSSSDSDDSGESDSESSLPTFTATTRLTLSERFGKMAQWSIDRSNMENMRITKDSSGGALKVMIAEGLESPPRRYTYSPAPAGHFPEELATVAPTGLMSWDDVRVRYDYYKSRGYLRDLDLKDYVKWEEWWYKYQEWLKQERYYEYWERQQMARRRRKKLPISQRLN